MALENEAEIKAIITKIYKVLDTTYVDLLTHSSYNYISQIVDSYQINQIISANLSEAELTKLVQALSVDEISVNKIISDNSCLDKFFKKVKDANTRPVVRGILNAFTTLGDDKRRRENVAKKQKENRALYKAARLTDRQKQVLTGLGVPIGQYETAKL